MPFSGYRETPRIFVVVSTTEKNQGQTTISRQGKSSKVPISSRKSATRFIADADLLKSWSVPDFLVYEVMRNRVMHQLRIALHVHLAEDARAVRAHGIGTEEEL